MKKITAISVLSIFGIALVASSALAGYGDKKKLSGYVKEYNTLIPLQKAKVKLYKKSGKLKDSDKTDKRGKYSFSDLSQGTYKVRVSVEGYRNPKDAAKNKVSKTIKLKKRTYKNLYLQKI